MKNNRNCGAPYPVYPYPMMPMNQGAMPMNQMPTQMNQMPMNQDISNQINNLEKRVKALENMVGNTGFNSNFQMM